MIILLDILKYLSLSTLDIFKHYIKYQWYSITNTNNSTISYII